MLGSTILDVAVGLSLVYFALSLLCSGIREAGARLFEAREEGVVRGLYGLLGESVDATPPPMPPTLPDGGAVTGEASPTQGAAASATAGAVVSRILDHGLVRGFAQAGKKVPPYIPAHSIALALLDALSPTTAPPSNVADVRSTVEALPDGRVKQTLLPLVNAAGADLRALQMTIERRVDDVMDRVSGWYKRRSQLVIGITAMTVAFGANVDTLAIARKLWRDPTVRAAVVARAQHEASSPHDSPVPEPRPEAMQDLERLDLPIGWDQLPTRASDWSFVKILGRLLTGLALLLGAPFWFDVLSKFGNLRSVGPKPARTERPGLILQPPPTAGPPSSR